MSEIKGLPTYLSAELLHYGKNLDYLQSAFLLLPVAHFLFSAVPSVDPSPIRHIQPPRNQHFYRKQALPEYHQ